MADLDVDNVERLLCDLDTADQAAAAADAARGRKPHSVKPLPQASRLSTLRALPAVGGGSAAPWEAKAPLPPSVYESPARDHSDAAAADAAQPSAVNPLCKATPLHPAPGSLPPKVGFNHTLAAVDEVLVCFGGVRDQQQTTNECYGYTPATGEWAPCFVSRGVLPAPRSQHSAVAHQGNMVVFGGRGTDGHLLDDVHAYNVNAQAWALLETTGKAPAARCGHTAVVLRNRMFIFGGRAARKSKDDGAVKTALTNDVYVLDLVKLVWHHHKFAAEGDDDDAEKATATEPSKRCDHAACAAPDGVGFYVSGGEAKDGPIGDIWHYTPASRAWRLVCTEAAPRARHGLVTVGGHIAVLGGTKAGSFLTLLTEDRRLVPKKMVGTALHPARHSFGYVAAAGFVYVIGGFAPSESAASLATLTRLFFCEPRDEAPIDVVRRRMRRLMAPEQRGGSAAPADVALDLGGKVVYVHSFMLHARAPRFLDAVRKCASETTAAGSVAVTVYHLEGNSRRKGFPLDVTHGSVAMFIEYVYTGRVRWGGEENLEAVKRDLGPIAQGFHVPHLQTVLAAMATEEPYAARTARADYVGDQALLSDLGLLIEDTMTVDTALEVTDSHTSDSVAVGLHVAVAINVSPTLRKALGQALGSKTAAAEYTTAGLTVSVAPSSSGGSSYRIQGLRMPTGRSTLQALLRYVYMGDTSGCSDTNAMEVLLAADRLGLDGLKAAAERHLAHSPDVVASPDALCDTLRLVTEHRCPLLTELLTLWAAEGCNDVCACAAYGNLAPETQRDIVALSREMGVQASSSPSKATTSPGKGASLDA